MRFSYTIIGFVAIALSPRLGETIGDAAISASSPNIIYILTDDLGYGDLGCYGQSRIRTPHIDRLADEGMRFTEHYAGSTVCAPSRCALMTGRDTGHARIRGNGTGPLLPEDVTVAELLKRVGYRTACIGKWGLGEADSTGAPWRQGFDFFFGYLNQSRAHFYYPRYLWRNDQKVPLSENDQAKRLGRYSHDLVTDEALAFVRRNTGGPFFLYLAYTIPHAENTVPRDSMEPYLGQFPERPHTSSHYGHQPMPRASYAGMVSRMDRDVGRLMDLLKHLGIDERTIVMFSSDNGPSKECGPTIEFFKSNGPFRGIKRDLYEGGIRVPLIVRWPGRIAPGTVSDLVTAQWDFLATAADLAGVPAPGGTESISIAPTLLNDGRRQAQHPYLYWEFHEQRGKQALRLGDWKGVRLSVSRNPEGPLELYHLRDDVGETRNVAGEHPDVVRQIAGLMRGARTESPTAMFVVPRLPDGPCIPRDAWRVVRVDSESTFNGALAAKAFDGHAHTRWHTQWKMHHPPHPHELVIDLGADYLVHGFRYLPRVDGNRGTIRGYEFYVSGSPDQWQQASAGGMLPNEKREQEVTFEPTRGRFVLLRALSCHTGSPYTSCAELNVLGRRVEN